MQISYINSYNTKKAVFFSEISPLYMTEFNKSEISNIFVSTDSSFKQFIYISLEFKIKLKSC